MDPLTMALMGGGILSSFFGNKKPKTQQVSTLNPAQESAQNYIQKILTQGATPYDGQQVAPMTQQEGNQVNNSAMLGDATTKAFLKLLSGEFPEQDFQNAVQNPLLSTLKNQIIPMTQERFAGPHGNFLSTANATAVQQEASKVTDAIAQKRGEWGYNLLNAVTTAGPAAAQSAQGFQAALGLPRTIDQATLDAKYNEFLRTNPNSGAYLGQALQFLGIPTQGIIQTPGSSSGLSGALFSAAGLNQSTINNQNLVAKLK